MTQETDEESGQKARERENAEKKGAGQEELHNAEVRLKALSDAPFEAIFLSEEGISIDQNLTAEKLFGYTLQEARGRHGLEWIIPEDRELVKKSMLLDYAAPYEVTALRKDGTTFPCEIQARNLLYDGRTVRVTALRDITERKQAEKDKENLQAKLANAIEMAHLGPWEYDVINDTFIFNDSFYKMFRTTAEQVGGYAMTSAEYAKRFVHPDEMHMVEKEVRRSKDTTDPHYSNQLDHRIVYADGTVGYITVRIFVQKDAAGRTVRTFGVNQDITKRKQAEEALRQLNEQLAQRTELAEARAKQLQALAVELIESEERERLRISRLLHDDLQQILVAARFQLQAAFESLPPELQIIERLLEQSISKSRVLSHELNPVSVHHSLANALEQLIRQMSEQFGLDIQLEVNADPQIHDTLKVFIVRTAQELLFNIVKHAGVKTAQVALSDSKNNLVVSVSDQGSGFNSDLLNSSTGLGLLSMRERAGHIGAQLDIESTPGRGSRFTLTIPIRLSEAGKNQMPADRQLTFW